MLAGTTALQLSTELLWDPPSVCARDEVESHEEGRADEKTAGAQWARSQAARSSIARFVGGGSTNIDKLDRWKLNWLSSPLCYRRT